MQHLLNRAELTELVFRHKLKIIFVPAIIFAMTIGIILFYPRKYRSEARLFLQMGRESLAIDPTATTGPSTSLIQANREEEVKSALEVIASRGVISQVVDRLGPEYVLSGGDSQEETGEPNRILKKVSEAIDLVMKTLKSIDPISDREAAIIEIEKNLSVGAERYSMVLAATLDAESPAAAQRILDSLVEVYQAEHLRIHRNAESGAFLADQRDLLRKQYLEAQQRVKEAKNSFGVASLAGRRNNLEAQLQSIELNQIQTRQEYTATKARIGEIESQLTAIPEREKSSEKSIPNEGADLLRKELYTNQMRLMEYKSRLIDSHPLVVATSRQVDEGQRLLNEQGAQRQETVDDINPIYRSLALERRQLESVLAGLTARTEALDQQHGEISNALERFSQQEIELVQLEHDEQIARDKFLQYTNNLEQARVDEALEKNNVSSVSVAQSATLAEKPVSPSKALVLLGGMFMAVASVLVMILISESLNDRIRNESDLARTVGLPVLAAFTENNQNRRVLIR
jgi:polysaccharide biosynthesis protein PslE